MFGATGFLREIPFTVAAGQRSISGCSMGISGPDAINDIN